MLELHVFLGFAKIQSDNGGVGGYVKPSDLQAAFKMSRSTAGRYMKKLCKSGYVKKLSHGKYALPDSPEIMAVGFCVLTPIDIIEYRTNMIMNSGVK